MQGLNNIQNYYHKDFFNKTLLEKEMMIMLKALYKRLKTIE